MRFKTFFVMLCGSALLASWPASLIAEPPEIVSVKKIWDRAKWNGFTDLIRFEDRWYCCFREADGHAPGHRGSVENGRIRVIVSPGGEKWESAALLAEEGIDLRDPKLSITADGRLMLLAGGSVYNEKQKYVRRASRVAFSNDGRQWTPPVRLVIDKPQSDSHWLWRATWHEGKAYALSKLGTGPVRHGHLYWSTDGIHWHWITEFKISRVSETTLRVMPDGEMMAFTRPHYIGSAKPPYKEWTFNQLPTRVGEIGGPNFIRLPDGSLWAAGRESVGIPHKTILAKMTHHGYQPVLTLPSEGDSSYPGMVWHDGLLWMSYYSSHEGEGVPSGRTRSNGRPDFTYKIGKTSIYLAKIRIPLEALSKR